MPVYLVTDRVTDVRTMVEASRPAGALSALIDNRFDVSPALDATDALKLITQGIAYLASAEGDPVPSDPPEFSEVSEKPIAALGRWSTEAAEVAERLR